LSRVCNNENFTGLFQNKTEKNKLPINIIERTVSYRFGFSTNKYKYKNGAIKKLDENTSILWLFMFII